MALAGDTGNGTTVTFGTSSLTLLVTQIQIGAITIPMLDVSTLATTDYQEMISGDLKVAPEVTLTFVYESADTAPVVGAAAETMTVTFPLLAGGTTAATLAGTAQFTEFVLPSPKNNEIMMGSCKFKFNGDTGPTYTKAT